MNGPPLVSAEDVSLVYQDHGRAIHAVRSVRLNVLPGEFLGILGPSGSGKSSLLYLLSGLKDPTAGEVSFAGDRLAGAPEARRAAYRLANFGFVFQQPYLLGYVTARENVLTGAPHPGRDELSRADELLDRLGLGEKAHRRPHELSGGERQRVCVARALINRPRVVFADEPTAALDHDNGRRVVELLDRHREGGALVMVTHDPEMLDRADRIVRIADGSLAPE